MNARPLLAEIARVLRHDCEVDHTPDLDFEKLAQQKAIELLRRLPDLRVLLEQDVEAAYVGDPAAKGCYEIIFCYPGLEAVAIYRIAHELLLLGVPLIPRMMTEYAHSKTGIDIHPVQRPVGNDVEAQIKNNDDQEQPRKHGAEASKSPARTVRLAHDSLAPRSFQRASADASSSASLS